jgi:hypothetical protein
MKLFDQFVAQGNGLYTVKEAARYARTTTATVSRWVYGSPAGDRVFPSVPADEKFISFVDFVQVLAVRNLRFHYGVSLQKIRDALDAAEKRIVIEYPL